MKDVTMAAMKHVLSICNVRFSPNHDLHVTDAVLCQLSYEAMQIELVNLWVLYCS